MKWHAIAARSVSSLVCGAICALVPAGCSGGYRIKPARVVRVWEPAAVTSASAADLRSGAKPVRYSRENAVEYQCERREALDDESPPILGQVGVGFPVRDWVSGYFDEQGRYVRGAEWVRSEDGD